MVCSIAAFKNTDVANVAIIYATAPFAAAAIAWFWMRERPAVATLLAAVLCLIGVLIMVGGLASSANLTGDMLAVGMTILIAEGVCRITASKAGLLGSLEMPLVPL